MNCLTLDVQVSHGPTCNQYDTTFSFFPDKCVILIRLEQIKILQEIQRKIILYARLKYLIYILSALSGFLYSCTCFRKKFTNYQVW